MAKNPKAISAAVDLYLALYPALVLYKLRMNRRKKTALNIALGLGSMYVSSSSLGYIC